MPSKRIVCLANSRKHLPLRCIAGKSVRNGDAGTWIRPVNAPPERGISPADCAYEDGSIPNALDVIRIEILHADQHIFQSENFVIDPTRYWEKVDEIGPSELADMVDDPGSLWELGHPPYNDRVSSLLLTRHRPTLYLIRPENVQFRVEAEGARFNNPRRKVRAFFSYGNVRYGLSVTDTAIEDHFRAQGDGLHSGDFVSYFTVSLAELHTDGYAYKVIAAVF